MQLTCSTGEGTGARARRRRHCPPPWSCINHAEIELVADREIADAILREARVAAANVSILDEDEPVIATFAKQ